MSETNLRLLFRNQREQHVAGSDSCPDDILIGRMLGDDLADADRDAIKAHVADCAYCASRLADALRASAHTAASGRHAARDRAAPGLRNIAIAAAVAIVAVTVFWLRPELETIPGDHTELRNVRQPEAMPALIFPREGQTVSPAGMMVRWTPVDDAMHYSVRIVDDYGRIVVDSFADAPEFRVPSHIRLAPGANYYVKVDAYVVGDKAVSSSHISFTVAD